MEQQQQIALKRPLLEHQTVAVNWMTSTLMYGRYFNHVAKASVPATGVLLTDEPGLGKTTSTLATLATLRQRGFLDKPCLVVCPANCINEWCKEVDLNFGKGYLDVRVYKDSSTFDKMHDNTIVLLSYTSMLAPFAAWVKKLTVQQVISDPLLLERYYVINHKVRPLDPGEVYQGQWDTSMQSFFAKLSGRFANSEPSDNANKCGAYLFDYDWGCVVMDEAQKVKSSSTATAKCLAMVRAKYRIALTGTPVMNDADEIKNIMRYGLLYAAGSGFHDVSSELYRLCSFGRLKNQVRLLDVPANVAQEFNVVLSTDGFPWDRQLYLDRLHRTRGGAAALDAEDFFPGETKSQRAQRLRAARNTFFGNTSALQLISMHRDVYLRAGTVVAAGDDEAAAEVIEPLSAFALEWTYRNHKQFPVWFQQRVTTFLLCMKRLARWLTKDIHRFIVTHWAHMESGIMQPSPKLLAAYDIYKLMIERDPDDKLIIMSSSRVFLERHMMPYFRDRGVGSVLLCGASANAKLKTIKSFESDPNVKVMCAVKSVVGLGLNLQHASGTVILCEPGWNDAIDSQAVARVDRTGQLRVPHIYRLLWANSVDTAMMELQSIKRNIADSAVHRHEDLKIAKVLRNLIDMNPDTALVPRPGDAPITYNQGFLSLEPVRRRGGAAGAATNNARPLPPPVPIISQPPPVIRSAPVRSTVLKDDGLKDDGLKDLDDATITDDPLPPLFDTYTPPPPPLPYPLFDAFDSYRGASPPPLPFGDDLFSGDLMRDLQEFDPFTLSEFWAPVEPQHKKQRSNE